MKKFTAEELEFLEEIMDKKLTSLERKMKNGGFNDAFNKIEITKSISLKILGLRIKGIK